MSDFETTEQIELDAPVNEENTAPRTACVLVLDTSASMSQEAGDGNGGRLIDALNSGVAAFATALASDPIARKSVEVEVISCGGSAQIAVPFTEGRDFGESVPTLVPSGSTPLGSAIEMALDSIESRKKSYRDSGIEYYRPWVWILTDGAPTDGQAYENAAARLRTAESERHVAPFGVCIGASERTVLQRAMDRPVVGIPESAESFKEMFEWLSKSLNKVISESQPGATDGEAVAGANEQIPLEQPTWIF